ncbi:unnamed protein product, partial [Nesidiocoris tenuis]
SGVLGGWWFGGSPSSPDSNFLRVVNAFPNRRLSDNTLMTPKIRIAPSCASSPGGYARNAGLWRSSHPTPLEHRPSGAERFNYQLVPAYGESIYRKRLFFRWILRTK